MKVSEAKLNEILTKFGDLEDIKVRKDKVYAVRRDLICYSILKFLVLLIEKSG